MILTRKQTLKWIPVLILFLSVLSCKDRTVFEQQTEFSGESWEQSDIRSFSCEIEDTISSHRILLNLRHTGAYPYQNLFIFAETENPQGIVLRDTLELFFADETGRWLGAGSGTLYAYEYPFKRNVRFPIPGKYEFRFEQAMRMNELPGIHNLGIQIERIHGNIE